MSSEQIPAAAPSLSRLIQELQKLPGIGPKSAQRLAYYLIRLPADDAYALADAITAVKQQIILCGECQNLTDESPCSICSDSRRDRDVVCVVEDPLDVLALERTNCYRGLYHVLHGVISPMNGVGPEDLRLKQLVPRLEAGSVEEVIIATNPTLEGDGTALYISNLLQNESVTITRLARGIASGSVLEFANKEMLADALRGADVFIGLSAAGAVSAEMVSPMAKDSIVFAMANPIPEIFPDVARAAGAAVVGTGRSDFPNQINNSLVFPGVFRGALDCHATRVTTHMKLAAATALAALVEEPTTEIVIPWSLDLRVAQAVSQAVAGASV